MARFQAAWQAVDIDGAGRAPGRRRRAHDAARGRALRRARPRSARSSAASRSTAELDRIALVETRANGQPALAAYADGQPYGVMVFACERDRITGITGFPDPALFPRCSGLP